MYFFKFKIIILFLPYLCLLIKFHKVQLISSDSKILFCNFYWYYFNFIMATTPLYSARYKNFVNYSLIRVSIVLSPNLMSNRLLIRRKKLKVLKEIEKLINLAAIWHKEINSNNPQILIIKPNQVHFSKKTQKMFLICLFQNTNTKRLFYLIGPFKKGKTPKDVEFFTYLVFIKMKDSSVYSFK